MPDLIPKAIDGEPRIGDLELARRLGFSRPSNIRNTIKRNEAELLALGGLLRGEANSTAKGGRRSAAYLLNERQALAVAQLSETPRAADVRREIIDGFLAYRRGAKAATPTQIAREQGKQTRKGFTFCLAAHGVRGDGFRNCTNAVYQQLFGATADGLRKRLDVKPGKTSRDRMSHVQLMSVGLAEALSQERIETDRAHGNEECEDATVAASRVVARAVDQERATRRIAQ